MLSVIEYGKDEYDFPALLVLGCFDAIHIGHRDLIKKAKLQAKINGLDLGVMLFRDGKGEKTVYSLEERLAILEEFSVKFVLVIDFTDEFKKTSAEDFLREIEDKVNVKAYMSGKDFRFGAKAKGKSSTLKNYAEDEENGVWYMPVKDVMAHGEKVSTTLIKDCLERGDIALANELLGSQFSVSGEVVQGAGRGASQLGYPTVNIDYPENKFPVKQGVYKVKSTIEGKTYLGIANYGTCPTFGDDRVALEVYFDGFDGDLYGQTLTVTFLGYIRDIVAFASPEELVAQLDADKALLAEEELAAAEAPADEPAQQVEEAVVAEPADEAEAVAELSEADEETAVTEVEEEVIATVEEAVEEVVEEPVEETTVSEEHTTASEDIDVAETEGDGFDEPVDDLVEEAALNEEKIEEVAEKSIEEPAEAVQEAEDEAKDMIHEEYTSDDDSRR